LELIEGKSGHRRRPWHNLTLRESEVLFWLGRGKSNGEIAAILGIKPATVGKHLEHIYPKLGVENRTAAASFSPEAATLTSA
jgi:DNA-binding CsgD family transcriptional regulator